MKLDMPAIARYIASEGGGRYQLHAQCDGTIVIEFINKHGSVFDIVDAASFALESVIA